MTQQLPDKLSELIRVALADLEKCEKDVKYKINMNVYHCGSHNDCHVCFAGVVMSQTLEAPIDVYLLPLDFGPAVGNKLAALDRLRKGEVKSALRILGYHKKVFTIERAFVADYHEDPDQFKDDMRQLAARLESEGL